MQAQIRLERNKRWAPNGPMDYARSARRYKFEHTPHAPVFYSRKLGVVLRRDDGQVHYANQAGAESPPSMTGKAVVTAEDIQNGESSYKLGIPTDTNAQSDLEYICPVTIGTPGVTLRLDLDTGSANLWVWSSEYRGPRSYLAQHTVYDPSQSTTSQKAEGLTWGIDYGDKSHASGIVYTDKVVIGGIAISNQAVGLARELSPAFHRDVSDGLLGLALSGNTIRGPQGQAPQKTPVQNMVEQGVLDHPVFTVKLDKQDSNGFYTFGYIDPSVTSNPILYTTVISSSVFWEFPSARFKIGSTTYQRAPGNTAIADTGTSLILLDDVAVKTLYDAIPGAYLSSTDRGYIFPTSAASSIPDISFAVGENTFSIPGKDLVWSDARNAYGMSYGSIQSRGNMHNNHDILGDVFLKRVYAVFEQSDTPRIGFAQRDH